MYNEKTLAAYNVGELNEDYLYDYDYDLNVMLKELNKFCKKEDR